VLPCCIRHLIWRDLCLRFGIAERNRSMSSTYFHESHLQEVEYFVIAPVRVVGYISELFQMPIINLVLIIMPQIHV
jgi:hypothetical protein